TGNERRPYGKRIKGIQAASASAPVRRNDLEGCRTGGDYRPSQHRPEHTDRGKYRSNGETGDGIGEQAPDRPGLCPEGVRHRQTRTDVHGPDRPAEPVEQQLPQDAGRGGEDGHEGAAGHHFGRAGRGGEQRRHHLPDHGHTRQ
ncbi:hypothetical protein, partial [Phocaeicola vulgatus]|uniref:hypothetical protein n=6 Tax=Bacteroidaceae TaxID=815 RepID=UPI00356B1207